MLIHDEYFQSLNNPIRVSALPKKHKTYLIFGAINTLIKPVPQTKKNFFLKFVLGVNQLVCFVFGAKAQSKRVLTSSFGKARIPGAPWSVKYTNT